MSDDLQVTPGASVAGPEPLIDSDGAVEATRTESDGVESRIVSWVDTGLVKKWV